MTTPAETRALLVQWKPLVYGLAWQFRRRLAPLMDFEDITAIGMIALWKAIESFDPENEAKASFQTYAKRVVLNAYLHHVKQSKYATRQIAYNSESLFREHADGSMVHNPKCNRKDPEAELATAETNQAVQAVFAMLPAQHQRVIDGLYLSRRQKNLVELAESYGCSRQAIAQTENRALERMRRLLEQQNLRERA